MKKRNIQGYSLIEMILYVGVVAVLTIGVYQIYSKRQTDAIISVLNKNLILINQGINAAFSANLAFDNLNNATLINSHIVPEDLIDNSNINNKLGGNIVIQPDTVGGNPGYSMTLDHVPDYACTKMATTNFSTYMQEVSVNGINIKTSGSPVDATQIQNAVAQCASSNGNNTIVYKNTLPIVTTDATGLNVNRNTENTDYIPTISDISSSSIGSSCTGGSTWNGSFCSCPSNTEWNGTSCVTFNTTNIQVGWCPRGQGWLPDTKTCATLPYSNPDAVSGNQYNGGRNLPIATTTAPTQTFVGGRIIANVGAEVVAGRLISWQFSNLDNKTVQTCVNGSWDATNQRCDVNLISAIR